MRRVAACNGAATRSGRPTHRHTTHNGRLLRTIGHRTHRKHLAAPTDGGRQNPTPHRSSEAPYTSALARCGRRSPLFYRLFNGGVRPRAAPSRSRRETSEPHAMRACAMAPLAPCLRQIEGVSCGSHRFCTRSITCRPSEAALDGPGPAAVKASVDEGMSSREPSSYAAGAPAVDLESSAR